MKNKRQDPAGAARPAGSWAHGKNAEHLKEFAQGKWGKLNTQSIYVDKEGEKWTVVFKVDFTVNQKLSDIDKNNKGLSYDEAKNIEGVQKGDNFINTDCLPSAGRLEEASLGGSSTCAPSEGGILHGLFHNFGFDDDYENQGDVMSKNIPTKIDQKHFEDAAKTVLGELNRSKKYPALFKTNENGEKTEVFQGKTLDHNQDTEPNEKDKK